MEVSARRQSGLTVADNAQKLQPLAFGEVPRYAANFLSGLG